MIKKLDNRFVILSVILLACLVLVVGIVSSHINQQRKQDELKQYEQMQQMMKRFSACKLFSFGETVFACSENTVYTVQNAQCIATTEYDERIAGIARDQLGYGESDEKVYINITGK